MTESSRRRDPAKSSGLPAFSPRKVLEQEMEALNAEARAAGEQEHEWDPREVVLLGILERQTHDMLTLEAELAKHGPVDKGSMGQTRVSPIMSELRLLRVGMVRTVEAIRLPDEPDKPKAIRQQRAARSRWDRQNGASR